MSSRPEEMEDVISPAEELEEREQDALQECYFELSERMDPDGLRCKLYSLKLLTHRQNDEAMNCQNRWTKNEALLKFMRQRSGKDVLIFVRALFETKQLHCGNFLLRALENKGVDVSSLKQLSEELNNSIPVPAHQVPQHTYHLAELDPIHADLVANVEEVVSQCVRLRSWGIQLLTGYKSRAPGTEGESIDKAIEDIQQCCRNDKEDKIFMYLQPFFDKIDVRLLEGFVTLAAKDESAQTYAAEKQIDLKQELDKYKVTVGHACKSTLQDCPDKPASETPTNEMYIGLQTSAPPEDITIKKIIGLKRYLIENMGMKEAAFEGFACSDVCLFFSVNMERLPFLIHWCYLHRQHLVKNFNITLVFVPGHFVYSMEADQEYPFPKVCSVAKHGQSSKHVDPQGFVAQETSHLMNGLGQMLDEIVTERLDKRLADIETKTDVLTNTQMAIAQKQRLREDDLLGRILSLQKLAGSMTTDIVGEPKGSMQKVQVNFEKVLDRLNSLERVVEEGRESKKSPGFSSTSLDEVSDDLSMKIEKHKAMLEDFGAQFRVLGEDVISKVGEEVEKKLHAMEEPFQVEIPTHLSGMMIGTRGQNLRRIERKTGVHKMSVIPSNKEGVAYVTLFGDPVACEKAKIEVRIVLASYMSMNNKSMLFLTNFSGDQLLSFKTVRAHEDILSKKHYRLLAVDEKNMSEALRNLEFLGRRVSEAIAEMLKSPTVPQIIVDARFGKLFWKTDHALTQDDLECKYNVKSLEKNGLVNVERIVGTTHWTFQTINKTPDSDENIPRLLNAMEFDCISIGEIETIRITLVYMPEEADKDYVLCGLNARKSPEGGCHLICIEPRMKKEIAFDCLLLEGSYDLRIALSSGPACSEEERTKMTEFASEMTEGMRIKEGCLHLDKVYSNCRILHIRYARRKLYLMNHEGYQYILVDSDIEDCHVGRIDIEDDATEYPLKDCHGEMELWNCQWLADFALLEKKDWREFFVSAGCDVSKIEVTPKPVEPKNIEQELSPYVRCAMKIALRLF